MKDAKELKEALFYKKKRFDMVKPLMIVIMIKRFIW